MISQQRTLIALATYNEAENLPRLVERLLVLPGVEILVVDDASPDGTGQWAQQAAQRESRLHVIHRSGKLGLGSAILEAFQFAIDNDFAFVVNMDADFSHDPQAVPRILAAMDPPDGPPNDLVIGSRYVAGGGTPDWPLQRRLMSFAINRYTRFLLWLPLRDCSSGFRCFRTSLLQKLDPAAVRATGYAFHEEMLWHFKRLGGRFCEVPIIFTDRRSGHSKINVRESLLAVWIVFRLGVKNWLHI